MNNLRIFLTTALTSSVRLVVLPLTLSLLANISLRASRSY